MSRLRHRATDEFLDRAIEKHPLDVMSGAFNETACHHRELPNGPLHIIHRDRCVAFRHINPRDVVLADQQIGLAERIAGLRAGGRIVLNTAVVRRGRCRMELAAASSERPGGGSRRAISSVRFRACGSARSCIQPWYTHSRIAPASCNTAIAHPRTVRIAVRLSLVISIKIAPPRTTNPCSPRLVPGC